jgi:hypothetical protein
VGSCRYFIPSLRPFSFLPHLGDIEHIEEVHASQYDQNNAYFSCDVFDALDRAHWFNSEFQEQAYKTKVDQVKPHQKEVIHRVYHFLISVERF